MSKEKLNTFTKIVACLNITEYVKICSFYKSKVYNYGRKRGKVFPKTFMINGTAAETVKVKGF